MKFREIYRYELAYQLRRLPNWVYFIGLFAFGFLIMRSFTPDEGGYVNSPQNITVFMLFGGVIWGLLAASVAGDAAARDFETGMHPLAYTAPVSKLQYLGGRFLGAYTLNALLMLALETGILLSVLLPRSRPELIGPHDPTVYVALYVVCVLPNVLVATIVQFSAALFQRRAVVTYLASVLFGLTTLLLSTSIGNWTGNWDLAALFDVVGFIGILREMESMTPLEAATRNVALEAKILLNRVVWIAFALVAMAYTYRRFQFAHPVIRSRRWNLFRRRAVHTPALSERSESKGISVPQLERKFSIAIFARQTFAIAWTSFRTIAKSRIGLTLIAVLALGSVFFSTEWFLFGGEIALLATTAEVLAFFYTPPLDSFRTMWIVIPLLIVFYAGELIWHERDAGVSEIVDTSPVPEWALFLGRFLGLALVIFVWMALFMVSAMLVQVYLDHAHFDIALYVKSLFGLQLADYLLFALLALVVHAVVDQKYLGYAVALAAYGVMLFPSTFGIEHKLLIYGSDLGREYSPMRGFDPAIGPWLWFKLYWAAWALLLAVAAKLFLARGRESGFGMRLRMARQRFTRATVGVATAAVALILAVGGFIFYNTNVLNAYRSDTEALERRAEYERRYGQYEDVPQPSIAGANLRMEIYPARREVDIRGSYRLVNNSAAAIDAIHVAPSWGLETAVVGFDRPAKGVVDDDDFGHHVYALEQPLAPGDTLRLDFEVRARSRGFRNTGIDLAVVGNGTNFMNDWLPSIGYQSRRELSDASERRLHGLPPQPPIPSLYDSAAYGKRPEGDPLDVETIVGTDEDQTAIAPGLLRRTWIEGGRRYFHYVTDGRIGNQFKFFSANYAVREARWGDVAIQIFHHPAHTYHLDRTVRSVQAALTHYTQWYGPYPFRHLRIVEHPGPGRGAHVDANTIDYPEGFASLNPKADRDVDLPYHIVAHEVAHQWWGSQLAPALVEGAGVLSETLATYSAMQVLDATLGAEHLNRYLRFVRLEYGNPRSPAMPPLLQAVDGFSNYRKGPLALYALGEYIGQERVRAALRSLLEKHGALAQGKPLPTTLDLYRELKAVTPEAYQSLLHDLFAANTFWELETEGATAEPTPTGEWQVTLPISARKVVIDIKGVETEMAMDDWIEVGVFAPEKGDDTRVPQFVTKHRIRSGEQTIIMTVPRRPERAGIDPRYLLNDWATDDNIESVKIKN